MKRAVTLSILGLVAASLPAFACNDKSCEHMKGHNKASASTTKEVTKHASKVTSEKKVEKTEASTAK